MLKNKKTKTKSKQIKKPSTLCLLKSYDPVNEDVLWPLRGEETLSKPNPCLASTHNFWDGVGHTKQSCTWQSRRDRPLPKSWSVSLTSSLWTPFSQESLLGLRGFLFITHYSNGNVILCLSFLCIGLYFSYKNMTPVRVKAGAPWSSNSKLALIWGRCHTGTQKKEINNTNPGQLQELPQTRVGFPQISWSPHSAFLFQLRTVCIKLLCLHLSCSMGWQQFHNSWLYCLLCSVLFYNSHNSPGGFCLPLASWPQSPTLSLTDQPSTPVDVVRGPDAKAPVKRTNCLLRASSEILSQGPRK